MHYEFDYLIAEHIFRQIDAKSRTAHGDNYFFQFYRMKIPGINFLYQTENSNTDHWGEALY